MPARCRRRHSDLGSTSRFNVAPLARPASRLFGILALVVAAPALAATDNPLALDKAGIYEKSLAALTLIFVVAVLLENAFAIIFNWRVFLAYFSRTGVKTIVMVVVSLIVVNAFDLDIVASLISAYQSEPLPSTKTSKVITALILAGGSAGVYSLMRALGYRRENPEAEVEARPPRDQAWIAVRAIRKVSVGPLLVRITDRGPATGASTEPAPIAGTITFGRQSLADLLFRRSNRFPPNGGYALKVGHIYSITVEGKDAGQTVIYGLKDEPYAFAPGAIVDIQVTL